LRRAGNFFKIARTDKKNDAEVYEFYDLTEEEIKMLNGVGHKNRKRNVLSLTSVFKIFIIDSDRNSEEYFNE
jgi:hypothetical protein